MRMPRKWRGGGILSAKIVAAIVGVVALVGAVVPLVHAEEPQTYVVHPGKNTLKEALSNPELKDGDVLQLEAGSYTSDPAEDPAEITSAVTIKGSGSSINSRDRYTTISVPLVVNLKNASNEKQVVLQGFSSSNQTVTPDYKFITVKSPVDLTINDVYDFGVHFGDFIEHDATSLLVTSEANGAKIAMHDAYFFNGTRYGIRIEASNINISVDGNSRVAGRSAISLSNGNNNNLTFTNTTIDGRQIFYRPSDAIEIEQQSGTTLTFENCTINGIASSKLSQPSIIAFKGGKSSKTTINLNGTTKIVDQATQEDRVIFRFSEDAKNGDENVINVAPNVTIKNSSEEDIDVAHKYNMGANYAVVGVYDHTNKGTIKVYDNGTQITDMKDEVSEGYKHKGWFTSKEYSPETAIEDKTAKSGKNFDAYQKAVKLVTLTIKDVPTDRDSKEDKHYILEQNETIGSSSDIDSIKQDLAKIKAAYPDQKFQHYILTDDEKVDEAETYEEGLVEQLYSKPITKNSTIEANHAVAVTINEYEQPFLIEAGQTLEIFLNDDSRKANYEEAKFKNDTKNRDANVRDDYFWHYVDTDGNVITEATPITGNIELTSEYYYDVSVEGNGQGDRKVAYNQSLNSNEEILSDLEKIKNCETSSPMPGVYCRSDRFSHFVDTDHDNVKVTEETLVTDDMHISAVFDVEIQIGDQKFYLDANTSINDDLEQKSKIEQALKDLKNIPDGQELTSIVISPVDAGPSAQDDVFSIPGNGQNADALIESIMKHKFNNDAVIYPKCSVSVTIKGAAEEGDKTFKIDTGKTLGDIEDQDSLKQVIYRGNEDRFHRLAIVAEDGSEDKTFDINEQIHQSVTLRPKFYYTVTLKPLEADQVVGKVEEGTAYNAFIGAGSEVESALNALFAIESNQGHDTLDEVDETHLHYEGLKVVGTDGGDIQDYQNKVNQDITVSGIYHYDLDIVTNYEDPTNNVDKYTINFEKSVVDAGSENEVKSSLNKLKASIENDQRKFYTFYNEKSSEDDQDITEDKILNAVHKSHLYINAKVAYKVEIGGTEGYVPEGKTLKEATEGDLVAALNSLENPTEKKHFESFVIEEGQKDAEVSEDMVINEYTKISASYNVEVKIGEQTFTIPEGRSLQEAGKQDEATAELESLKEHATRTFERFNVGEDIKDVLEYKFNEDTTVEASFKTQVFIDDQQPIDVQSTDTWGKLKEEGKLDDYIKEKDGKVFSRFVKAGTDTTYPEDDEFGLDNVELETKWGYKITIGNKNYVAEEEVPLREIQEIMNALEATKESGKNFARFVDEHGATVDMAKPATKAMTIKPVYNLAITIKGIESDETLECIIDEGATLSTCPAENNLEAFLDKLEGKTDQKFSGYAISDAAVNRIYNGGDVTKANKTELMNEEFSKPATVTAKYKVNVTVEGSSEGSVELDYGTKYADKADELKSKVRMDASKYSSFNHFEFEESEVKDDTLFTKHTTLAPKFNVKLTIEDAGGKIGEKGETELLEGKQIQEETGGLINQLRKNAAAVEKTFKEEFEGGQKLTDTISENTTLKPLYTIDVTINDSKETLDEGSKLTDHSAYQGYKEREGFKEFRDENGRPVDAMAELHKHTKVTAIYTIKVTVPEKFTTPESNVLTLESGQKLSDLGSDLLARMQQPDAKGRTFSRFEDAKGNVIGLEDPLYESLTIVPKYNNTITITPYADGEVVEGVEPPELELELGEGWPLTKLTPEENESLRGWLNKVSEKLAAQGKPDYNPTSYLLVVPDVVSPDDETLTTYAPINLDTMNTFKNGDKIHVVFTYSPKPVIPDTPPTTTPTETEPVSPKAPNTGSETTDEDAGAFTVLAVATLTTIIGAGTIVLARRVKFDAAAKKD